MCIDAKLAYSREPQMPQLDGYEHDSMSDRFVCINRENLSIEHVEICMMYSMCSDAFAAVLLPAQSNRF